jgi:hypothetical protein
MTDQEIISRIIELESEITGRIISDRTFREKYLKVSWVYLFNQKKK